MFSQVKHPCQRPPSYFAWGCFRYFGWEREPRRPCGCLSRDDLKGGLPSRSSRAARPAFARWALAWQPSLRNGLPDRLRTGGEGVSQSPLKVKAFSIFRDQNPPFELRPGGKFFQRLE